MIDKLFPRILSSDKDNRIRPKVDMNDALNVVATEDFNAVDAPTDGGNSGVLKPVKGNEAQPIKTFDLDAIFPIGDPPIQRRVLGRVSDPRSGVVYMFIYSEDPSEQGVYAYDAYGFFPGPDQSYRPIYTTSEFQFESTGRVVGDVVHITDENDSYRTILYFTDDVNEPRKLDVNRCVDFPAIDPTGFNYFENSVDDKDVITACPKGPVHPIQFTWQTLPDQRISNFRRVPGMQFAFQCVYQTGEESAISTYSDIAVPDEYLRQGYYTSTLNLPHYLQLVIPSAVNGVFNFTQEVDRVRLLVRRGNIGAWYVIDEVDWIGDGGTPILYDFYNDRVLTGLTNEEQNRDFEALPQVAQALAVVENRLMYGNYVEGFDEVPLQASVDVNYYDRPQEFLNISINATPVVAPIAPFGETQFNTLDGDPTVFSERTAGVVLDFSTLPDVIPANSVISCNLRFDFAGSIELYTATGTHHASQIIADNRLASLAQTRDGSNQYYASNSLPGDVFSMNAPVPVAGYVNEGVGSGLRWRVSSEVASLTNAAGNTSVVRVGTSGTSPLRFQGPQGTTEQLSFNVVLRATQAITSNVQTVIRNAVLASLEYGDPSDPQFEVLNVSNQSTYSFNLNLQDPTDDDDYSDAVNSGGGNEDILSLGALTLGTTNSNPLVRAKCRSEAPSFAIIPTHNNRHLDYAKLISPVISATANVNTGGSDFTRCAAGWIIVNSATLTFRLRGQDLMSDDPLGNSVLTLEVSDISSCDVRTCIPIVNTAGTQEYADYSPGENWLRFEGWRVFSGDYLYNNDIFAYGGATFQDYSGAFSGITEGTWQPASLVNRARYAGWLVTDEDPINPAVIPGDNMYVTNSQRRQDVLLDETDEFFFFYDQVGTSLVDGQFTPAVYQGRYEENIQDPEGNFDDQSGHVFSPSDSEEIGCYGTMAVMFNYGLWGPGTVGVNGTGSTVTVQTGGRTVDGFAPTEASADGFLTYNCWERIGGQLVADLDGIGNVTSDVFTDSPAWAMQTDGLNGPQPEIFVDLYVQQQEEAGNYRSFKTNATHALGIIYYDERGRPGNVNPIDPVYVAGYSPFERNGFGFQGRVDMTIDILSDPPQWAHFYQLVYGGSLTVQKFIQYSAAGAYIATSGQAEQLNNIYVSLNYLQFHPTVSYSEAFGAVHPDGTSDLYVFSPGDYLRVISYFTDETTQVFPENYLFEIAGQVTLGGDAGANVLFEAAQDSEAVDVPEHLQGQFLILKDNISATGFNFAAVASEGNSGQPSTSNYWGNRCVFEIITPRREADLENLVYRETSQVYNVGRQGNNVYHQTPTVLFQNGDVWWRSVPINIQQYDGGFVNLIQTVSDDEADTVQPFANTPRFRNVYVESATFNDTFPGTDVNGYGKAKIYRPDSAQVRRFASIIFGDDNNYSTRRVRFTVFNPSLAPFKDLPNEHGAINALLNYNESLFVVQEDKASMVPVNRQIISDALGSDTLIATAKVLGEQKLIPGHAGADNNRESVIKVDDTVYFAHKGRHEVYRYVPGKGVEIISNAGLNAYFVSLFRDQGFGVNTRVVSGYDSLKDEYIITVIQATPLIQPAISEYTQPPVGLLGVGFGDGGVVPNDGGGGETGGGGGADGDGVVDVNDWETTYDGPISDLVDEVVDVAGTAPDGVAPGLDDGFPGVGGGGIGDTGNGVIDVASTTKLRLDQVTNGSLPGFTGSTNSSYYEELSNWDGTDAPFTIDMSGIIPPGIAETLGSFNIGVQVGLGGSATYDPIQNVINATPSIVQGTPQQYPIISAASNNGQNVTAANYGAGIDFDTGLLKSGRFFTVREALQHKKFYLERRIVELIAGVKNGQESAIINLVAAIGVDIDSITDQLNATGLNNEANVAVLLTDLKLQYDQLVNHIENVLGGVDVVTLTGGNVTLTAAGFGEFGQDAYPLTALEMNALQTIKTLMQNLQPTYIALQTLDGINLSSTIEQLLTANSSLRGQVDVLADQVQALSDIGTTFNGGATLIPGVNSNQLEEETVGVLAQDGELTFSDVIRDFQAILQFIIDNNATIQNAPLNAEVSARLAIEIYSNLSDQVLNQLPNVGANASQVDPTTRSIVEKSASQLASLRGVANDTNAVNALRQLPNVLDPYNITGLSGIATNDLIDTLIQFGDQDVSGNELNPAFPVSPLRYVSEQKDLFLDNYLDNYFALDTWLQLAEGLGAGLELLTAPGTGGWFRDFYWLRVLIHNLEAGVYEINTSTGAIQYADPNVAPVVFGWEDGRITQEIDQRQGLGLTGAQNIYNIYSGIGFFTAQQAYELSLNVLQTILFDLNSRSAPFAEAINSNQDWIDFHVNYIANRRDANVSNVVNPAVMLSPFSRYANPTDLVILSPEQRDQAIADAINYVQQNY